MAVTFVEIHANIGGTFNYNNILKLDTKNKPNGSQKQRENKNKFLKHM
jgi:hypothetical protein